MIGALVSQLREVLNDPDDPGTRRLFPSAYPDDPERDLEYSLLAHSELTDRRLAAIEVVEQTLDATNISDEQHAAWIQSVNAVRLILGTRLDVDEEEELEIDSDDPDAPLRQYYAYLGWVLENLVAPS